MLNPINVDELIAKYTAHTLRGILFFGDNTPEESARIIAAIHYLEGTDND